MVGIREHELRAASVGYDEAGETERKQIYAGLHITRVWYTRRRVYETGVISMSSTVICDGEYDRRGGMRVTYVISREASRREIIGARGGAYARYSCREAYEHVQRHTPPVALRAAAAYASRTIVVPR